MHLNLLLKALMTSKHWCSKSVVQIPVKYKFKLNFYQTDANQLVKLMNLKNCKKLQKNCIPYSRAHKCMHINVESDVLGWQFVHFTILVHLSYCSFFHYLNICTNLTLNFSFLCMHLWAREYGTLSNIKGPSFIHWHWTKIVSMKSDAVKIQMKIYSSWKSKFKTWSFEKTCI